MRRIGSWSRGGLLWGALALAGCIGEEPGQEGGDGQIPPTPDGALPGDARVAEDGAAPDMALVDMASVDMALVEPDEAPVDMDPAEPDMASLDPDMAQPDVAQPDVALPDMASPDMTLPDMALPDMALPDMALPDATSPDMALPDMAPPDMNPACLADEVPCNGIDDNCDGRVDEIDEPRCFVGLGACRVQDVLVCVDGALVCHADPWPGLPEACNDIDDDCDGATDEGGVCDEGAEDCAQVGDEDGDGVADCDDSDCFALRTCRPPEDCMVYGDEDGNGDADCDDVACSQTRDCRPLVDIAEPGGQAIFNSSIDSWDPLWSRPGFNCMPGPGGDYYFELNRIVNLTGRPQTVDVVVSWQDDGYLFLYDPPFDPARPEDCVMSNDDYMGTRGSRLVRIPMEVDQERFLIMSARRADDHIGRYRTVITTHLVEDCAAEGDEDFNGVADCDDPACAEAEGCVEP